MALMPMPEAPVDENNGAVFGEDNVGTARQVPAVQPVTETQREEPAAYEALRLRVFSADLRHAVASLARCQNVGHSVPSVYHSGRRVWVGRSRSGCGRDIAALAGADPCG